MTQKILVCGFPHCGTYILKTILGHIEDVEEITQETERINTSTNKPFILCKYPFTKDSFFDTRYKDYVKIFIIRNPLFVFSSLNKRFNYKIPNDHSFEKYVGTIKKFIKHRNTSNVYHVRYEDMFNDDFKLLKDIISNIGIEYKDDIFENTKYQNKITQNFIMVDTKPDNIQHVKYRTWQINQPFVSNNENSKLDLSDHQKIQITNNPYVLQLYPDIKDYL